MRGLKSRDLVVELMHDHEQMLTRIKTALLPYGHGGKLPDDQQCVQLALYGLDNLLHRAFHANCPHAKHALQRIGLSEAVGSEPTTPKPRDAG